MLLGFAPLLFALFLSLKKEQNRNRMKEKLETHSLHTIVIPANEVIWVKKHEIKIRNRMFDIKTSKLENGVYTFSGLYDDEETSLIEKERHAQGKKNEQNRLLTLVFKSFPSFCNRTYESPAPLLIQKMYGEYLSSTIPSLFREILTPPPQV